MLSAAVANIHEQLRVGGSGGGANQGWNINGPYWGDRPNIPTKIFYLILVFDISQVSQKNLKENRSLKMAAEASARISTAGAPCSLGLDTHCAGKGGKGKGKWIDILSLCTLPHCTFTWSTLTPLIVSCKHCAAHCRIAHSCLSLAGILLCAVALLFIIWDMRCHTVSKME